MDDKLTHYIIVRRDLPLGVIASMVTHAAGESAFLYKEDTHFMGATAVVLEVKNERDLMKACFKLLDNYIPHTRVTESGGVYAGQMMAIGIVPCKRDTRMSHVMKDFQVLKESTAPPKETIEGLNGLPCSCSNCRGDKGIAWLDIIPEAP